MTTEDPRPTVQTRVAVLVGSTRPGSTNRRVAELLRDQAPDDVLVELAEDLDEIPFYTPERDAAGESAAATALRELVGRADRVLVVTPEHNGTAPPVLSNAIDWLSRPYGAGAMTGKPFAAIGTTPTRYGGAWSHEVARRSARIAGAHVVEDIDVSVPANHGDPLADPEARARFMGALRALVDAPFPRAA